MLSNFGLYFGHFEYDTVKTDSCLNHMEKVDIFVLAGSQSAWLDSGFRF